MPFSGLGNILPLLPPLAPGFDQLLPFCCGPLREAGERAPVPSPVREERMLDLRSRRAQLGLFVAGLLVLSMTAEKFRELVGEEAASKSGKFTFLNCFDMNSGTFACAAKEGVKLYVYTIRSSHVEQVRRRAIEVALAEAITGGLNPGEAAKQAERAGAKAAKLASRQAKRILGPIISSGWDFFEAVYFGGTLTEGFLRGSGTLVGTYVGGFLGEERLGRVGYLMGSHLGSWVGGRMGLMVYDVINGVSYLVQSMQTGEITEASDYGQDAEPEATHDESSEASADWGFL